MKCTKTNKRKKLIGIISLLTVVIFSIVIFIFLGKPLIELVSKPQVFRNWVEDFGFLGQIIFILMIVLQVVIAIIPGEPFEIAAGYAFGSIEGTLLCLIGVVIGSIIIFLLVRKFGIMLVEIFFSKEKINSLKFLKNNPKMNMLFFILMLIPGTPKDLFSYFAGLTDIKLSTWITITAIARIPSIITSSVGGSMLGEQKFTLAIIAFGITILLSITGLIIYNKIQAKNNTASK